MSRLTGHLTAGGRRETTPATGQWTCSPGDGLTSLSVLLSNINIFMIGSIIKCASAVVIKHVCFVIIKGASTVVAKVAS